MTKNLVNDILLARANYMSQTGVEPNYVEVTKDDWTQLLMECRPEDFGVKTPYRLFGMEIKVVSNDHLSSIGFMVPLPCRKMEETNQ